MSNYDPIRDMLDCAPRKDEVSKALSIVNTAATVVVAIAAVFAVIAQSKDNPKLAWGLAVIASLALASTLVRPVVAFVRKARARAHDETAARNAFPEFREFVRRFGAFVSNTTN